MLDLPVLVEIGRVPFLLVRESTGRGVVKKRNRRVEFAYQFTMISTKLFIFE
jgi:hypothetical protein